MSDDVCTDGLMVWDFQRKKRRPLNGEHSAKSLVRILQHEWIRYFDCDQCGRVDYCKFVKPHRYVADRHADIQCGVAMKALQSFVESTFAVFKNATQEGRQAYLDGAHSFLRFVYIAEQRIGGFLDDACMNYWGEAAPLAVAQIVWLREDLDNLARALLPLAPFRLQRTVLLVEGAVERSFVEGIRKTGLAAFLFLAVESYDGKSNRRPGRLQMLLDRYAKDGYTVYIQGDADGKGGDPFRALRETVGLPQERTFAFEHDFESSVPEPLLCRALTEIGALDKDCEPERFSEAYRRPGSISSRMKEGLEIDIEPFKVSLAHALADALQGWSWWADDEFMGTELGSFLGFCQTAHPERPAS